MWPAEESRRLPRRDLALPLAAQTDSFSSHAGQQLDGDAMLSYRSGCGGGRPGRRWRCLRLGCRLAVEPFLNKYVPNPHPHRLPITVHAFAGQAIRYAGSCLISQT
eukprot:scaffold2659_cov376-Prasinococcus_capsulatus_cf.AAC.4